MAAGNSISCRDYATYLVTQTPVFDKEILKDVRPTDGLMGYYPTKTFDAYNGVTHLFDRFVDVYPDTTKVWNSVSDQSCVGNPCDPEANQIGYGNVRASYSLVKQSWETPVMCFDQIMTRTRAKEHTQQIITDVLGMATKRIMNAFLYRQAIELADKTLCVTTGLPEMNWSWDSGGYVNITTTNADTAALISPTGRLTADILRTQIKEQYALGAISAGKNEFQNLELHTDIDTFRYLGKEAPTLYDAWRFGEFAPAAKEFYKYGLTGYIGDFMVKCLQFPFRFNKLSNGRFQQILPYKNIAATEGIRSVYNSDYDRAQYQFSLINNRRALTIKPFKPEAVNAKMPFLVRDYGGSWKFGTNDLGADCQGRPIDNVRGNKGKFYADFQLAVKPEHTEWLVAFFHKVDRPCVTIIDVCNSDPGYPEQDRSDTNAGCPSVLQFQAILSSGDQYSIAATGITCDGNQVTLGGAIAEAVLSDFVDALQIAWAAAGQAGEWTVDSETDATILLTGGTCTQVNITFL